MKFSITSVIAIASIGITGARAGINCNGSGNCPGVAGDLSTLISFGWSIDPNRWYNNGEHIVCVQSQLGTGLCAFLQNTGGAPGSSIQPLLQALQGHGCNKCGSVPMNFLQGDNSEDHGELTVNAVGSTAGCSGIC